MSLYGITNMKINVGKLLSEFDKKDSKQEKTPIVVYLIENIETGKYYFGATSDNDRRKKDHIRNLEHGKNNHITKHGKSISHINKKLQEAYNDNPNFIWKEIPVKDIETAYAVEKELIKSCRNDPLCLNMLGGLITPPMLGKTHTPEARNKISEKSKAFWDNNPEFRTLISELHTGNTYSVGIKRSPEFCEKISERLKGNEYTLGLKHSEETKVAISNFQSNRSPELAEKIRVGHMKAISINGVVYNGLIEASKILGIEGNTIHYRLNAASAQFKDWFYI